MNYSAPVLQNLLFRHWPQRGRALRGEAALERKAAVVLGREAVSAMQPLLVDLGRRTGQTGALDLVSLLVRAPSALRKTPCLVLVDLRAGVAPQHAQAQDLRGAVLLYEYRLAGANTGLFATDDIHGERTVLAAPEHRTAVAEAAGRALIERGAIAALISFESGPQASGLGYGGNTEQFPCPAEFQSRGEWKPAFEIALRTRSKERDLLLRSTLDDTLATLGPSTRRNLRRYRMRAKQELGLRWVPDVQITPEEFLELDQASTNPAGRELAAWRYHFVHAQSGRVFTGLRDGAGRWLSLLAGYRHGETTVLEWQMNRDGLPRHSLSTVLRSFVIESEIARGTRVLRFKGGTPHTISHWLEPAITTDLIVLRHGTRGETLRWLSPLFPESNFLGRTLTDPALCWKQAADAA